jgi:8-oxo-dGTP pyrophosphatase MutT (NUDIX family)
MLIGVPEIQLINDYQPVLRDEQSLISASVALILRDTDSGTEVLMMQRAKHERDPWSGQMSFPGGKIEASDDSSKSAAIREAQEEVGVELTDDDYLGRLDDLCGLKVNGVFSVHVRCFVFKPTQDIILNANHEVAELVWLPLAFLEDPYNAYAFTHPKDPSLSMPSVMIDNSKEQILWGMSLRMIMNLYSLLDWPLAVLSDADKATLNSLESRHLSKENADKITQTLGNRIAHKRP